MQSALKIEQLTVYYDKEPVLWDINLNIPKGSLVGILGPNGAGKSTLFKALVNLLKPLSGKITFFGKSFNQMRKRIAYVPQRSEVDWDFPVCVIDVVLMGAYREKSLFHRVRAADRQRALSCLKQLGIDHLAGSQISELSGGQQQRVFLARSLMQDADIYLLDEPFAAIDLSTEKLIIELLKKLQREGKTILIIHHDLSNVSDYFDWVMILNRALISCGTLKEAFTKKTLARAYGKHASLLEEATKISQQQTHGMR